MDFTSEDVTRNNLPRGVIWEGFWSEDTDAGKFLIGIGQELERTRVSFDNLVKGFDFLSNSSMLDIFEQFLGIPDARLDMQGKSSPISERQRDVFAKLFLLRDNSEVGLQKLASHYSTGLTIVTDPDENKIVVEISTFNTSNLNYDHDYDLTFQDSGSGLKKVIAAINYIKPVHTTVEERIV